MRHRDREGADLPEPTTSISPEPSPAIEIPPVDGPYDWTVDPGDFVSGIDNPYFPSSREPSSSTRGSPTASASG